MGEEGSIVHVKPIYGGPRYLWRSGDALEKTKEKFGKERPIWKQYEHTQQKHPPKEEKEKHFKKDNFSHYRLGRMDFAGYAARGKREVISMPIIRESRGVFNIPHVLQRQTVESKVELSESTQKSVSIISTTLKSQTLTATASVATIISLFALFYGFSRGYWALVGIGLMSLVVIFIDLWKVSLRESKDERSAIKVD